MAEGVVTFLLETLRQVISDEATLLLGVDEQVRSLHSELEWLRSFLRDADGKRGRNERVKVWVGQIRDVAYDAEDVVESFLLRVQLRQRHHHPSLRLLPCCHSDLSAVHSVGRKIEEINRRIERISSNKSKYGIESIDEDAGLAQEHRRVAPMVAVEEAEVVGFDEDARILVDRLLQREGRRSVVPIVGMGGLGKTTLARKVYNYSHVKRAFDCQAWVTVSQEYQTKELLLGILRCVVSLTKDEAEAVEKMGEKQLGEMLRDRLEGKKYLVAVDDIWTREAWSRLEVTLPRTRNGSRILLTTRNKDVALYADPISHPHELKCLGEEESWVLFCKKALLWDSSGCSCPADLHNVGREIVAKCAGLPLAIVVIGGLLLRKERSLDEWERVRKSVNWQLSEGQDQISKILALSYNDLPYYLKSCFLYFGVFPEDSEIPRKKLVRLWVAEGFVQRRGEMALEDVAEDYLEELIHRSLVQVAKRSSNGRIKSCCVHDLLHNLAISEAKEDKFLDHHSTVDLADPAVARRLSLQSSINKYVSTCIFNSHIRSLLCFLQDEVIRTKQLVVLFGRFKLLRVIDLNGVHLSHLPSEIGDLVHLRYLGFKETHLNNLPSSICNLCNLQTLDIRNTSPVTIPAGVWRMHNLKHIYIGWLKIPTYSQIDLLASLQTLATAVAGRWIENGLSKLTNLRKLAIRGDLNLYSKALSESILKLGALHSLRLRGENSVPIVTPLSHHVHLYKLSLTGHLDTLPELSELPPNLTKITLNSSKLEKDPMKTLGRLPNLQLLRLTWNAYLGKDMTCSADGFPQLKVLKLEQLHEVEEWRVEEGGMPRLRSLHINKCYHLKGVPNGLQHVTSLQELELRDMPEEFVVRLQENVGSDWPKIQHISSITIR